tara:strand:- start:71 stop:817 length:747 start_codon:yes stop_codon:yes gene_type:complete
MKIIEVVSMRRAGHHAFANWLVSNLLGTDGGSGYCEYKFNIIDSGNILWINEAEINYDKAQNIISEIKPKYLVITYEVFQHTTSLEDNPTIKVDLSSLVTTPELIKEWGVTDIKQITFVREFWNNFSSLFNLYPFYSEEYSKLEVQAWLRYYKLLVRSALETNGIVFDKWIQNETYSDKALRDILGIERKVNPLSTKGTYSSFGDTTPAVNSLLNRRSQVVFPKWFLDIVEQDDELAKLLIKLQILIN